MLYLFGTLPPFTFLEREKDEERERKNTGSDGKKSFFGGVESRKDGACSICVADNVSARLVDVC